ncbi:MAG: MmgE/PrpD family protein [Chloroflexota bacterium]
MDTIAEYIASYGASTQYGDLPPEVVHKAKGLLMDTFGCALGAYTSEPSKIVRRIAGKVYQCDTPATIFGSGQKSSPELATFANGVMIRYLDFNDGFASKAVGHPSDNFAPIVTCADAIHAGGREVIVASVLAYEVFCRLSDQETRRGGFDQATTAVISCVMGASKILGLSQEQMVQAINLAITPNISLGQARAGELSMWKGCAVANAARNAVFAAFLAKEGMTGPSPIFEGRSGFFQVVTGPFKLEEFGGPGRPFRIMDIMIKRYPCGMFAQTAIDAAIKLRSRVSSVDEIERVNIGTFRSGKGAMAGDDEKWHPKTRETADHSIPFVVAVALMYGTLEVRYFDDKYLFNPDLLDLMQKIKVEETEECNNLYPDACANRVELVTRSGQKFSELVQYHRGHQLNPLTNEEIEQKFTSLTRDLLTSAQRKELFSLIWNLEQVDDIGKLMQLLTV